MDASGNCSQADELLHLPHEIAGVEGSYTGWLAEELVHLPHEVAGVEGFLPRLLAAAVSFTCRARR